ncbi:MAG: hypothetical protein Q9M34_11915 [Sulfurimonas sp.]|nr:hypothetical protein [Sulfurimonas sp.]
MLLLLFFSTNPLSANTIKELAKEYKLHPGTKATIQWERIFSSKRHLERYKLTDISPDTREELKTYLVEHAADSEQPILPGL